MPTSPSIPRRRSRNVDPAHPVYELDLWLVDSQPLIWRSLLIPAHCTLEQVHQVIQCVMPWGDYHMHAFETKGGQRFEMSTTADDVFRVDSMFSFLRGGGGPDQRDESESTLRDVFEALKEKLSYEYDFGDSWIHALKLIQTHADEAAFDILPKCLAGENAAPPEDSGGLWGYYEKLDILKNPNPDDEEHQSIIEWMGEHFDPARFDLEAVNDRLGRVFHPRPVRLHSNKRRPFRKRRKRR